MNRVVSAAAASLLALQAACAGRPDHFYTLSPLPAGSASAPSTSAPSMPAVRVHLDVTVPSMVDRYEMVLTDSPNGISILEHERWAAPLADEVYQTLARDIERNRPDVLVGDGRFDQSASPPVSVKLDIVRMTAQRGGDAFIEARWHIIDAGARLDQVNTLTLSTALTSGGYGAVARAYSQLLGTLAERLAAVVPGA